MHGKPYERSVIYNVDLSVINSTPKTQSLRGCWVLYLPLIDEIDPFNPFEAHTDKIMEEFQNLSFETIGGITSARTWLTGANAIWLYYLSISSYYEGRNWFNE